VRTSDDVWRWIWEDEDLLDEDVLGDLLGPEADRPTALVPPPQVTSEDVWAWIASDDDLIDREVLDLPAPPEPSASASRADEPRSAGASASHPAPEAAPPEYPPPPPGVTSWVELLAPRPTPDEASPAAAASASPAEEPPSADASGASAPVETEPRREPSFTRGRRWRFVAFLAVVALVGTVAPRVIPAVLPGIGNGGASGAPAPDQLVVAWTVRMEETPGATFVAVLAAGAKPPVAVAVPADVTINLPGEGLGTMGEAAAGGDADLVDVALENLMGVPIDASVVSPGPKLQAGIDAFGTIEVADQAMSGGQVLQYLTSAGPAALPDEPYLRWQDVVDGLVRAVPGHPEAVAAFPAALRPVLLASSPEPADLYALPVVDLGAGLVRPDTKALERFVKDHFLPLPADEVRVVVLNGVGVPGIGEDVARLLVPHGYRLMSSTNANTFDLKETKLIAASEEDLVSAQQARAILGVGRVFLGFDPGGLADVTIVVGRDFVAAHHLGGA
jgi:LytR cell envelope-related transcriptional attenuator